MTELLQKIISDYRDNEAKFQKVLFNSDWKVIATRYATEVAKRSLEKAAQNAKIVDAYPTEFRYKWVVSKQSIIDESNISL